MLAHPDWKSLTTLSHKAWEQGGYDGLKIVDSAGLGYLVKKASKTGYPGFLLGYSLLKQRGVRVDLVYESDPHPVSLEELRQTVITSIHSAREFWMAADIKQLLKAIKAATSHQGIIELVLGK